MADYVQVPTIHPEHVESTQGTYRTHRIARTPNLNVVQKNRKGKQIAGESSLPKPSLKIRIRKNKSTPITHLPVTPPKSGSSESLDSVSALFFKNLTQPWQTMFKVFNRCLTSWLIGHDQTKINIMQIFHDMVNKVHVDYATILWSNILHCIIQKKNVIQDPRFTKLISADIMEKYEFIPKRLEEEYHIIKDDAPLVNVYTTREVTVRGMQIQNDLLTDAIRGTHAYKDYVEKYEGVVVPTIHPEHVESTQGTEVTVRGMQIQNDLLTDAIRGTHAYKDYVEKYEGVVVPTIHPEHVESTQGTYRTHRTARTPNLNVVQKNRKGKQIARESSLPKPSLKIRIGKNKSTPITHLPVTPPKSGSSETVTFEVRLHS
nr:hypothetical protein [Tanacetum cinerariifolium]